MAEIELAITNIIVTADKIIARILQTTAASLSLDGP